MLIGPSMLVNMPVPIAAKVHTLETCMKPRTSCMASVTTAELGLFHTGFLRHAADEVRVDEPVRLSALGFLESCQMRTAMCAHLWSPAERPCGRTAVILSKSQFRSKYEKTLTRPASADTTAGQQKREAGSNPHLTGKVRTGASPRRRRLVRCFGFCVVVPLTFSAR